MSIVNDSYELHLTDPELVQLEYRSIVKNAAGLNRDDATFWFERRNLSWVVDALFTCISTHGAPQAKAALGADNLAVYDSGPEPESYINLVNERPPGSAKAGSYWIGISVTLAKQLVEALRIAALPPSCANHEDPR